jgi:NADPH:quinone reductase-like Zn-dependent oxidoreductase
MTDDEELDQSTLKMKAICLTQTGPAAQAFEAREVPTPTPQAGEVRILVESFGLNFADVMARLGLYPATPPLPCVLGYDVVGRIEAVGEGVSADQVGRRVMALTRFGGYSELAIAQVAGYVEIPDELDTGVALALATQGATAYYMAEDMLRLHPGDQVLVHAAAGGVGTCLVQLAKHRGCVVFGTASSSRKLNYLLEHFLSYGFYHPLPLMGASQGLIGVNMLAVGDHRPQVLQRVLQATLRAAQAGVLRPTVGAKYPVSQLAEAHQALEQRETTGKVMVTW